MLDPLSYNYHSSRPVRTLYYLMDRRWWFYVKVYIIFLVKHSPAWLMPFLIAFIVDSLTMPEERPPRDVFIFAGVFLILLFLNIPLQTWLTSILSRATRAMESGLRSALLTRLHQLSFSFLDQTKTGKLQAKILRDVEQVQFLVGQMTQSFPMLFSTILFALVYTILRQPLMLLYFILQVPLSLMLIRIFRGNMRRRNENFRMAVENMNADVGEAIAMIPVTRAHAVERRTEETLKEQFQRVGREAVSLDRFNAVFGSSSWVTFQASTVLALLVAFWMAWTGRITPGSVVIYQSLFTMIVGSVQSVTDMLPLLSRGLESVRSIGEVIECPDIELNQGRRELDHVRGDFRFDNVTFRYEPDAEPAVRDFSLDVRAGETIAFVGESGSGKSTLMALIIGFRRPETGRIYIDDVNAEEIDLRTFRRFLSVVPQQPLLFSGSIRENITYGLEGVSDDEVWAALEMANLRKFIEELPEQLDARVGEGGASLSGGQRQRVAIARAFVRDPRVIILDEATSALDVASEKLVQEAIERLSEGRTTFIIAHRLSTIRHADRIVVMNNGRIAEMGTRGELLEKRGRFAEMLTLQS